MAEAWVLGVGMITPVGDCAAQTASSVRAGISRYQESPVYGRHMQPLTLALLPEDALPPLHADLEGVRLTSRQARMLQLATPALAEALSGIDPGNIPVFLALPETLPGQPPAVDESFLDHLAVQSELAFDRPASAVFPTGRAGGLEALAAAREALDGERDLVLVGGVDSHLDLRLLSVLDAEGRVLADGVMDGFAPGEGAGFLLLGNERTRSERDPPPPVQIHAPGIASEPGHRYSEEPYRGDGLSEALAAALEGANGDPIPTVLASMNGENLAAKEWGVASIRHADRLPEDLRIEHPADCYGDLGAATAPVLLGLASAHMRGPCLVWCSSELETRGAVLATMPPE